MLSINNYIYTNKGIMSMSDLLYIESNTNEDIEDISVLSLDTSIYSYSGNFAYEFVPITNIFPINNTDVYETRFIDVYTNKNIVVNCTCKTQIFQYNILQTDNSPIINKNYQVLSYLNANKNRSKLLPRWEYIENLTDYSNKSPNISSGDIVVKYSHKRLRYKEPVFSITNYGWEIPVFASMTKSTNFNFILIQSFIDDHREYEPR